MFAVFKCRGVGKWILIICSSISEVFGVLSCEKLIMLLLI